MKTKATPEKTLNKKGRKKLVGSLLMIAASFVFQIAGLIVIVILNLSQDGLALNATYQMFAAGSVVLGMLLLGGASWLSSSSDDVQHMWKVGWPILVGDVAILAFATGSYFVEGATISPDWLPNLGITALMCVGIGVFEEFLYRGIILNGLLAVAGKTHRGTMMAVAITSLLFGLGHVSISTDFSTPLLATQAVLKIVQTGLFSVILCEVVLRTHRLGAVSIFHGVSDFLLMIPSLVLAGEALEVHYVKGGAEGMETIVLYLVIIAFYLPFAIKAIRSMHRERLTYRGAFMEKAIAEYDASTAPVATMSAA